MSSCPSGVHCVRPWPRALRWRYPSSFPYRFELFARIARLYGNLDEEVQANLDRTFKRIDDHRRKAGGELAGKRYGSVFRDDMKELQAKYRAGEKAALAQWIEKWAKRAGRGLEICA